MNNPTEMDTTTVQRLTKERELLKGELQELKHCQVQYFTVTITATGVVLGLAEKFTTKCPSSLIYFAPLFIILPCWTIFFDKAGTISRIVGYCRMLEAMLTGNTRCAYIGWETALRRFRKQERDEQKGWKEDLRVMCSHFWPTILMLLDFRRQHRYWSINWLTFCGLAVCSLLLAAVYGSGVNWLWLVFAIAVICCVIHNADALWELVNGKWSYDGRQEMWEKVLDPRTNETANQAIEAIGDPRSPQPHG